MKTIIRLGIVMVVLAINFSLNVVIRRLSVFERAHTLSNQEATLTIKLAIAQVRARGAVAGGRRRRHGTGDRSGH